MGTCSSKKAIEESVGINSNVIGNGRGPEEWYSSHDAATYMSVDTQLYSNELIGNEDARVMFYEVSVDSDYLLFCCEFACWFVLVRILFSIVIGRAFVV